MRELTVTPGVITNSAEIVALAERCRGLFTDHPDPAAVRRRPAGWEPLNPGRDSEYEDDDRYHVLEVAAMPAALRAAILRDLAGSGGDLSRFYYQLNRYDPGDYILPHRDTLQQGLYLLGDSDADGLVVQSGAGELAFVPDRAGTLVEHDPAAWHWVDPVRAEVRYTLVTIPPRPPAAAGHRR